MCSSDLILRATIGGDEASAISELEGMLTKEQIEAPAAAREKLLATGGDVKIHLDRERKRLADEEFIRLLPGYVSRFIEKTTCFASNDTSAPLKSAVVNSEVMTLRTPSGRGGVSITS